MPGGRYWDRLKAPDFRDLPSDTIAVLPCGATEQHGPHLPLAVDSLLVEAMVDRALPDVPQTQSVLVLPTLKITKSDEHAGHPGTLALSAETLLGCIRDIGASVARAGISRLVLLNGHGGNAALLQVAARDLRSRHDMIVVSASWSSFAEADGLFDPQAYARDLHAGESETSAMLAAHPDLVDMTAAPEPDSVLPEWHQRYRQIGLTGQPAIPGWIIDDLAASGVVGNARAADGARGETLLSDAASGFVRFLAEFAVFDHRRSRR